MRNKIIIESLMRDYLHKETATINVYCFNGKPEIVIKFWENKMSIWNNKLKTAENIFNFKELEVKSEADEKIKQSIVLSKILSKGFNFVRVDWIVSQNRIWFEELTFTPYSGFHKLKNIEQEIKLGKILNMDEV